MNKITRRLIVGISSIVLIATALIIGIFLSQYRDILLKQETEDIVRKADEIARFSTSIIENEDQLNQKSPVARLINGLTNSNLWIVNSDNQIILSTTTPEIAVSATKQITTDIDSIKKVTENSPHHGQIGTFITYEYSSFLGEKYISAIRPIFSDDAPKNAIIGYVILHNKVSNIYANDSGLYFLVVMSIMISLVLSVILGIFYSFRFTKPIERMTEVARQISNGNYKIKTCIVQDDEIGVLATTMDTMNDKLDANINEIRRLEESAKELVANVSHEFKTPLTIIRGHIENLQEGVETDTCEIYNKILNNTKLLDRLVNELLDLNKYQNGRVNLKIEQLELVQVVSDVVNDIKQIAALKNIDIITKIKGGEVKLLEADYIKFKQLITIILDNAIKFSPNKSNIDITIEDYRIIIKDHGKGIKEKDINHIFERFYRSDENNEGYGLGLCIAKYIADKHGFKIEVSSKINKGTTMTIIL